MHPCYLNDEKLLLQCETTRQRRSGPGGQHRNKVETAIRLTHSPTGLSAQASEKRSQAENLKQAIFRLRLELAVEHRTCESRSSFKMRIENSEIWKQRRKKGRIAVNSGNIDFPAMLADILDCLSETDWEHKETAEILQLSASQLIKFLKKEPRAFAILNRKRDQAGLRPLS